MIVEIKIPTPGESITEVEIASWLVEDGAIVEKDQELAEIESDKATLMLTAEEAGQIAIKAPEGETIKVGVIACTIDTSKAGAQTAADSATSGDKKQNDKKSTDTEQAKTEKSASETASAEAGTTEKKSGEAGKSSDHIQTTPVAEKMMEANQVSVNDILNGLSRLDKNAVKKGLEGLKSQHPADDANSHRETDRSESRKKMSTLRRKVSERLVQVKNETAMLTTFNEVDMSVVMEMRKKYQKKFTEKHGIKLGFMSFFTKAATVALKENPEVNAMIDGNELVYHNYTDIGIAVQTPKGLMVPVLRDTGEKTIPILEKEIAALAEKARKAQITLDELQGGTFSITNGGIFGSMLSTPIINPPQAGILGMHNIQERPVANRGQVVIRPMMYIALSYDHRVIDGKSSVTFLKTIKTLIENPVQLLTGGNAAGSLLDL